MKTNIGLKLSLCCLLLAGYSSPSNAQFKLQETFEGTTAPGWTLANSAILTAPSIDPAGSGWLRLTAVASNEKGQAFNDAFSFTANQAVVVEFSYVSWGGTGADGMTLFLYDSTTPSPMNGAMTGGGLGYCGGAGGYLAIGLDEYGNFSNPADKCTSASGGPGFKPESFVIRGPESATNAWVTTAAVPGGIDDPHVPTRPSPKTVLLSLTPAVAPAIGYTITAQFQSASGQPYQTLFSNVPFSYAPPANISVGFSGSTGGSTNNHELQGLITATPDDLQVTMTGPGTVLQGAAVTYDVTLTNNGNYPISAGDAPTLIDNVPATITGVTWSCTGANGATCDASGSGSISTANITLPVNASVTYAITGTLDPTATCGTTVANSADADFGSGSSFLDPDETNNSATVDSTVTCDATLVANPGSLMFGPQSVNVASASQVVTLTEGINTSTIDSIAVTGDYSQTNNCPASLAASQTCTINVVYTPSAEGSSSGTLTIQSNAVASPAVSSVVTLSGTGTNATPDGFSFTALNNVTPSSTQVSNAITVANTNVPSPISVSSGAQYSINGGAFTSDPGIVSPGAQVQVQLTAASGYSTADSAVLTIGGVSSTFTVTTAAEPVLQGGFAPVSGAAPASVQISNSITVTGITAPAPISVSSGAEYSIDGGAFTSDPGVVQPGDQLQVQVTAPSGYNTTASAVIDIDGVSSTFTVTTGAKPVLQGGFTPISGAAPTSVQISNPITVTGITAPAQISVSSGAEYSVDGGAFTSGPGTIQPGDQLRVKVTAPTSYSTTASATVSINGVDSEFSVTTGPQPLPNVVVTARGAGAFGGGTLLTLALIALIRIVGLRRAMLAVPVAVAMLGALYSYPVRAADDGDGLSNLYAGVRLGASNSSMTAGKLGSGLQADGYQVTASDAERNSFSGTLYLGYELSRGFSLEIAGSHLGRTRAALEGVEPADLNQLLAAAAHIVRGSGDIVALEGRYRWVIAPQIALDLRAGPYLWITKTDVYVDGTDELSRTDSGPGYTLGLNPQFALGKHFVIGAGADYFASTAQNHFLQFSATAEYHFK